MDHDDFLKSYATIEEKLKKRFLRKPNLGEASASYAALVSSLRRDGAGQYAAFCAIAVARCEAAQRNATKEAANASEAGAMLFELEHDARATRAAGFEENCGEAIHCYLLAIQLYAEQQLHGLVTALYFEMACLLRTLSKPVEASLYFQKAAQTVAAHAHQGAAVINAVAALSNAVDCFLEQNDYHTVVDCLWEIIRLSHEGADPYAIDGVAACAAPAATAFATLRDESRLTLVLLSILLRNFAVAAEQIDTLERESTMSAVACGFLRSIITIVRENRDSDAFDELWDELYPLLDTRQNKIMQLVRLH